MYPHHIKPTILVSGVVGQQYADTQLRQCVRTHRMLAVDVETTGLETLDNELVCVTIATPNEAFVVPTLMLTPIMKSMLTNFLVYKLVHNGAFDWGYLWAKLGIDMSPIIDTKRMAVKAGHEGKASSLKNMAKTCLDVSMDKTLATSFKVDEHITYEQACYSAIDALILWPLFMVLVTKVGNDLELPAQDKAAMYKYVEGGGPWPQYGEYPSLSPHQHEWTTQYASNTGMSIEICAVCGLITKIDSCEACGLHNWQRVFHPNTNLDYEVCLGCGKTRQPENTGRVEIVGLDKEE